MHYWIAFQLINSPPCINAQILTRYFLFAPGLNNIFECIHATFSVSNRFFIVSVLRPCYIE